MAKRNFTVIGNEGTQAEPVRLPARDAGLYEKIIEGYTNNRYSLRHTEKSVNRDLAVIRDMLGFVGKAPWYWTEEDFERWCADIGRNRKLAVSSQRHYQSSIRGFFRYMAENVRFSVEISRLCGIHIRQICTSENCIPHVNERELARERPGLTHGDVDAFFDAIDEELMMCARFRSKSLRPLQRDKTIFDLAYTCGLRAGELIGLDVTSFVPNPQFPAFGDFGFVSVWGKGSKGSGPRHRLVPNIDANLPALLGWYLEHVRPLFMMRADPNEKALFLSERGRRLSISALEERFHHILGLAGLEGKGYTPHSLRHSSVSHKNRLLSLEALRILHGHKFAATTQGYTHIPDEDVDREITKTIRASIRFAEEHKHD